MDLLLDHEIFFFFLNKLIMKCLIVLKIVMSILKLTEITSVCKEGLENMVFLI